MAPKVFLLIILSVSIRGISLGSVRRIPIFSSSWNMSWRDDSKHHQKYHRTLRRIPEFAFGSLSWTLQWLKSSCSSRLSSTLEKKVLAQHWKKRINGFGDGYGDGLLMWMNKLRKTHSSAWEAVDPLLLLPITGSSGKSSWLPVFVSIIVICYCCLLFDLFSVACLQASGWASGSLSGFELTLQSWSHRPLGPELSLSAHQTPLSQTGLKRTITEQ